MMKKLRHVTSLGHQGGRRVLGEDQIFKTMPSNFKLCPTHLSRGAKNIVGGDSPTWLRAWKKLYKIRYSTAYTISCEKGVYV